MSVRVLLVDDQLLIRAGFRALVESTDDLQVVGEAADGGQALDLARETLPDVVVMDIRMPVLDGLAATEQLRADPNTSGVRVLVLTTFEQDDHVVRALRAGASGFLGKNAEPAALLDAIRAVAAGEPVLSPRATEALIAGYLQTPETGLLGAPVSLSVLTAREREVVALVAHGLSNDDIAGRLFLSPLTAKTHVNRAMTKLGARDRAQLVVLAYRTGLVTAGVSDQT